MKDGNSRDDKKKAKRLSHIAREIATKDHRHREDARAWLLLIYIAYCLLGVLIGHAIEMAIVGAFAFVFMLACVWGDGPIWKAWLEGNSCLVKKDYASAIALYTRVLELGAKTDTEYWERVEQDPRDMMGD